MNAEALAQIAVRLLAVWTFVSAVCELPRLASVDTQVGGFGVIIGVIVGTIALYCGAAFVLWKWSPWVARGIGGGNSVSDAPTARNGAFAIGQVAVGVLGVFMLSSAVPESLWLLVAFLAAKLMGPSPLAGQPSYDAQMGLYTVAGMANAATVLARVALGVLLVSKPRPVVAVILHDDGAGAMAGRPTSA